MENKMNYTENTNNNNNITTNYLDKLPKGENNMKNIEKDIDTITKESPYLLFPYENEISENNEESEGSYRLYMWSEIEKKSKKILINIKIVSDGEELETQSIKRREINQNTKYLSFLEDVYLFDRETINNLYDKIFKLLPILDKTKESAGFEVTNQSMYREIMNIIKRRIQERKEVDDGECEYKLLDGYLCVKGSKALENVISEVNRSKNLCDNAIKRTKFLQAMKNFRIYKSISDLEILRTNDSDGYDYYEGKESGHWYHFKIYPELLESKEEK